MYDYLVVGAGLFGAVFAHEAAKARKSVIVIDKRPHIGGNIYTENIQGINVHKYGAHIFHTSDKEVWEYINQFAEFNRFTNAPIAKYKGSVFSLPFNMHTFNKMWGVIKPEQAVEIIEAQRKDVIGTPQNLEEQAISMVGRDIYETLVKGYTEKQWGRKCTDLPPSIIKRLPFRLTYDSNYFDDLYQGIPVGGYTQIIEKLLSGADVFLNNDYFRKRDLFDSIAKTIVFTGSIDEYYGFCFGTLEYRSLQFSEVYLHQQNYQGNAVVNYTDAEIPYTRMIEHKWFEFGKTSDGKETDHTIVTIEYSKEWKQGTEPYYPINDQKNNSLYEKYKSLAEQEEKVFFGGRLGEYKYYNMDQVVKSALKFARRLL